MKIGIFLPNATFDLPGSPEVGGIETFSFTVGEALQRMGHEVVLFGGTPKAGQRHRATTLTLDLHPYLETKSIPDLGTRFRRLVQRLHFAWSARAAWKRQRCDVLLLAKPFDWPVAWRWKKARPELKVIMGFHGTDFFAGDRFFYGAVDAAFAVSPVVVDLAETRVGARPTLIPTPVDVDFYFPGVGSPEDSRNAEWRLVSCGRLVGWKGFIHLIEAIARLRDQYGIVGGLSIAGEGSERSALKARIAALGLERQVTLCGRLEPAALRNLLRAGDLYVQPSIGLEAFSISALEAASVGLRVLLSNQVGLGSYLTDTDCAVYPARQLDALVTALKEQYERRNEAGDLGARHARIRERFSPERVARQILNLIGPDPKD